MKTPAVRRLISAMRLNFVFRSPATEPGDGWNSTVHFVRREIQESFANMQGPSDWSTFPKPGDRHRL